MKSIEERDLEEAVLKFWPQVCFRVRRSLGSHTPDWEDVAADVLLDVIRAVRKGKFDGRSTLGTFVYVITTRRIMDYLRAKYRKPVSLPPPSDPADASDPCARVEKKEQAERLYDAVKKLRPRQAEILYLYYYMGLTQKQVAEVYGLSTRRTNEIIRNARETLGKILRKSVPLQQGRAGEKSPQPLAAVHGAS